MDVFEQMSEHCHNSRNYGLGFHQFSCSRANPETAIV
jgi:hypothetical protein